MFSSNRTMLFMIESEIVVPLHCLVLQNVIHMNYLLRRERVYLFFRVLSSGIFFISRSFEGSQEIYNSKAQLSRNTQRLI